MNTASLAATWWFLTSPCPSTFHHTEAGGFSVERCLPLPSPDWWKCFLGCLTGRERPVWETDDTMKGTQTGRSERSQCLKRLQLKQKCSSTFQKNNRCPNVRGKGGRKLPVFEILLREAVLSHFPAAALFSKWGCGAKGH